VIYDCDRGKSFEKEIKRVAVRAVVFNNQQLLMMESKLGDFKLPGGGVEGHETHLEALSREVLEETGYVMRQMTVPLGIVEEVRQAQEGSDTCFRMVSYYYGCSVDMEHQKDPQLTNSERNLGMRPRWISVEHALAQNHKLQETDPTNQNAWINRETLVLAKLIDY